MFYIIISITLFIALFVGFAVTLKIDKQCHDE